MVAVAKLKDGPLLFDLSCSRIPGHQPPLLTHQPPSRSDSRRYRPSVAPRKAPCLISACAPRKLRYMWRCPRPLQAGHCVSCLRSETATHESAEYVEFSVFSSREQLTTGKKRGRYFVPGECEAWPRGNSWRARLALVMFNTARIGSRLTAVAFADGSLKGFHIAPVGLGAQLFVCVGGGGGGANIMCLSPVPSPSLS